MSANRSHSPEDEALGILLALGSKKKDVIDLLDEAVKLRPEGDASELVRVVFLLAKGKTVEPAPPANVTTLRPEPLPDQDVIRVTLPRYFAVLHTGLVLAATAACAVTGIVASVLLVPIVLFPIWIGPLRPWVAALTWLWGHGEVAVPLAAALAVTFAVPSLRRRAVRWLLIAAFAIACAGFVSFALVTALTLSGGIR